MKNRRIILLGVECDFTNMIYHELSRHFTDIHVVFEEPVSKAKLVRARIRKLGFIRVVGQLLFQLSIAPLLQRKSQGRIKEMLSKSGLAAMIIPEHKIKRISSANDQKSIDMIKQLLPDLIVINGTRILSKSFVNSFEGRIMNIHAGITPAYRGVHGAYWALVKNDLSNCGVTVHFVDSGIDTGNILAQNKIEISDKDNFATYPYHQFITGIPLLIKAIERFFEGNLQVIRINHDKSALWYHPTIWEYFYHWKTKKVK